MSSTINISPVGFCPHSETIDDYATRIEYFGIINNLTKEERKKLFDDGMPDDYDQFQIDAANTSVLPSKMDGSAFSDDSTKRKPKKLSDFVHSIFLMVAFLTVLFLFIRHFSHEAASNHNNDAIDE